MNSAPSTSYTRIAVELRPPAARVTLNNPPLNVIDIKMMEELRAALEQIEVRPEITVIVFAGSERAFSSGVDIAAHTPDKVRGMLADFHSVIRSIVSSSKLTGCERSAALSWRRSGTGADVRHYLRLAGFRLGFSGDQA